MRFQSGDIVLKSVPFGAALDNKFLDKACSYCLTCKSQLFKCRVCGILNYCSDKCQKADFRHHDLECEALSRVAPWIPESEIRLLCRVWQRYRAEKNNPSKEEVLGKIRTFESLMTHREERSSEFINRIIEEIGGQVKRFLRKRDLPDDETLVTIFAKLDINTHQVTSWDGPIGCALYLGGSIVDHSCAPNNKLAYFFDGPFFVMRALGDVDIAGIEDLHIGYVPFILPRSIRRQQLKERYFFECECERCTGSEVVTHLADENLVNEVQALCKLPDSKMKCSRLQDLAESEEMKKLPPNDYVQLSLKAALFGLCGTLERYGTAARIGQKLLTVYGSMGVAQIHQLYLLCQTFSAALNAGWFQPQNQNHADFLRLLCLAKENSELILGPAHYHSKLLTGIWTAFV